jgi:hypothetical protein
VSSAASGNAVEFDHDEFRLFFLGEGIGNAIKPMNDRAKADLLSIFRRGVLPKQALRAFVWSIIRDANANRNDVIKFILDISKLDIQTSYTQENCSEIIIRLLNKASTTDLNSELKITNLVFGAEALRDRKLSNTSFEDCYFSPTSLEIAEFKGCSFVNCQFSQLRAFDSTKITDVSFAGCTVDSFVWEDKIRESWEPSEIKKHLAKIGIKIIDISNDPPPLFEEDAKYDSEIEDIEKILRYFMRSTYISDSLMLMKLGARGQTFIDEVLPKLLKCGAMSQFDKYGGGDQRRFTIGIPLKDLNHALSKAHGSFEQFIELLS